mgnify:CR=1 FL=1
MGGELVIIHNIVLFERANYNNIRRDRYGLYDIKRGRREVGRDTS